MVDRPFTNHIAQTYPEWSEILQEQPPMTTQGRPHIGPWHKRKREGDTEREHCVDEAALERARSSAYGFSLCHGQMCGRPRVVMGGCSCRISDHSG